MITFILGMACLGHLAADFFSQFDKLPMKPFKCNMCITTWMTLGPAIALYGWQGILVSAIAGITSELIYRLIDRI